MKKLNKSSIPAILVLAACLASTFPVQAAEVDFSCMSHKVWPKGHVSSEYISYDIVIENSCPGAVYWAMCIERLDPNSHKVVENHSPTGYVEADKKARVNLNAYKKPGNDVFRNRFQEFYVDIAYTIDSVPKPVCFAKQCEAKKAPLRAEIRANEAAWKKAEKSLAAQVAKDCPDTGWDEASFTECSLEVGKSIAPDMAAFAVKDQDLRNKMAAIDPENCEVHSGNLATSP
jgi:hypothetical protein